MSKAHESRKALGKGLNALLASRTAAKPEPAPEAAPVAEPPRPESVTHLAIELVEPNPLQPRSVFDPQRLQELADSIKANGIIQPLVLRKHDGHFQLVAGERRWRAAKLAGLTEVPVVVQEISDEHLLEITLIENIQREDLNPIEVAHAFSRLANDLDLSHEEIARRTGKERSTITNTLRLLRLPEDVQNLLADHRLSMGHARAILALPSEDQQRQVAEHTTSQGLSVRQVERLIQKLTAPAEAKPEKREEPLDPNVKAALTELERVLGTRVRIQGRADHKGKLEIDFYSPDDLDRIYSIIMGEETKG